MPQYRYAININWWCDENYLSRCALLIYHCDENRNSVMGCVRFSRKMAIISIQHPLTKVFVAYVFIFMIIVFHFIFIIMIFSILLLFPMLFARLSARYSLRLERMASPLLCFCVYSCWWDLVFSNTRRYSEKRIKTEQTCDVIWCDGNLIKYQFNKNGCAQHTVWDRERKILSE